VLAAAGLPVFPTGRPEDRIRRDDRSHGSADRSSAPWTLAPMTEPVAQSMDAVAMLDLDAIARACKPLRRRASPALLFCPTDRINPKGAHHNPGCRRGLNPPVSSSDLAM